MFIPRPAPAPCPADAIVQVQALPAAPGVLVRVTARFPVDATTARAEADALVKVLADPALLRQMLPEANWRPRLLYTTFPYLVRRTQLCGQCSTKP